VPGPVASILPNASLISPGQGDYLADVIVVGGGNAALCAAICAAQSGVTVALLERSPKSYRGGNSRHVRNFRCAHDAPLGVLSDTYLLDEFYDDLLRVTKGNTDESMAKLVINASSECYHWMIKQGVLFQPSLSGTLSLSRTNAFFLGGGKALVNAYYNRCEELGVKIYYHATALDFHNFLIRGTPYNRGEVLKCMLNAGADAIGDPTQCHAVAIDGRAPEYDFGIVTRLY